MRTDFPSILSVVKMQALTALPSTRTVQVPQAPSLQPSFTLVRRSSSRRKRISFWFFSAATVFPFTVKVDIFFLLAAFSSVAPSRYI